LTELDCSYNEITETTITNCPKLQRTDFSANQVEELSKFDGSRLDYSVVSYIGCNFDNDDLFQQLKENLPGKKHEDINRLCFGCLTGGGHKNNSSYHYHAEVPLSKGGTIEYAVTNTGNKRETFEVPEEGGLLIIDIDSVVGGIFKLKRKEVKKLIKKEISEEGETEKNYYLGKDLDEKESEISNLKEQVEVLKKQVGESGMMLAQTEVGLNSKQEQ